MIFVLIFMLFFGFLIFNQTHKKGDLKCKKKFKLCFGLKKSFYFVWFNLFTLQAKSLLNQYSRKFAKSVDEILCKVKLLAPQGDLTLKQLSLRKQIIGDIAIFMLKTIPSKQEYFAIKTALGFNDFYA